MSQATQTFDILSRIAVGNGALVYRALDKETARHVAVKLLIQDGNWEHLLDADSLMQAAPRLRQISGMHVCRLLDAYQDEAGPILVYEFADGKNGVDLATERNPDPAQALDMAAQLISALRSGEQQRCPHGDLKPSNIVLADLPDGRPFLHVLDWGLDVFRKGVPEDSLPYLAPERLTGEGPSHRADLFSAGATLFFLFTGRPIVGGRTREELRATWRQARPAVLGELRPDLPARLVKWVCSLLELKPARRPASAADAETLLAALNPPPPPVPPEAIRPVSAPAAAGQVATEPADVEQTPYGQEPGNSDPNSARPAVAALGP